MGGSYLRDSSANIIASNNITRNTVGICIIEQDATSTGNEVTRNNFIRNTGLDGTFILAKHSSSKNTWDENYWSRPHLFPKLLIGRKIILTLSGVPFHFPGLTLTIPWLTVDPHPAKVPW